MREIKYQGWTGTKLLQVVRIHIDKDTIWWTPYYDQHEIFNAEHCPLREYTGLKDKNGKEIYEGDIIKDGHGISQVIIYCSEFDGYKFCQEYKGNSVTGPNSNGIWALGEFALGKYMEIIGNKYENPLDYLSTIKGISNAGF